MHAPVSKSLGGSNTSASEDEYAVAMCWLDRTGSRHEIASLSQLMHEGLLVLDVDPGGARRRGTPRLRRG